MNPTQNRRAFLGTLGLFSILPGAGRVWRAIRQEPEYRCVMLLPGPKHVLSSELVVWRWQHTPASPEYRALVEELIAGHATPPHLPAPGTHWRL